jgi:tungstate transport system ATP-binding protein
MNSLKIYELINIKKYYANLLALDIPWLSLYMNNFYIVYGPNGAGKTTFLNLLSFLDKPSEGKIILHKDFDRREISMLLQNPYLFKTTVMKNVTYGLKFHSINKRKIEEMIASVMNHLGLWTLKDKAVGFLSGGEKAKVAFARTVVLDTKILLLDEPTAYLDTMHTNLIESIICDLARKNNKMIVMATNDLNQAYRLRPNVILHLSNGKMKIERIHQETQ